MSWRQRRSAAITKIVAKLREAAGYRPGQVRHSMDVTVPPPNQWVNLRQAGGIDNRPPYHTVRTLHDHRRIQKGESCQIADIP